MLITNQGCAAMIVRDILCAEKDKKGDAGANGYAGG